MSSSKAKCFSLFICLTLLSILHCTHARDSKFFNKLPSATNKNAVPNTEPPLSSPQDQDPNFLPENENAYGLYSQDSGQVLSPSTTTNGEPSTTTTTDFPFHTESKQPLHKYLPKNYNPVAYVTVPEDTTNETPSTEENNYPNNNNYDNYLNNQQDEESEYTSYPTSTKNNKNTYFNSEPQGTTDTSFLGGATTSFSENFINGGETGSYKPQGMSDTRSLQNGRFFYDVNSDKYDSNHPYASLRGVRTRNHEYNNENYYGNSEDATYEFNGENYQNQDEFQDAEVNYNLP